jgi:hypothetical protein
VCEAGAGLIAWPMTRKRRGDPGYMRLDEKEKLTLSSYFQIIIIIIIR